MTKEIDKRKIVLYFKEMIGDMLETELPEKGSRRTMEKISIAIIKRELTLRKDKWLWNNY